MHRRHLLALGSTVVPLSLAAQVDRQLPGSPVDALALVVIPTDGIAEQAAGAIARGLAQDTGLRVRATLWAPSGVKEPLAGTLQYPADDYLPMGPSLARQLSDAGPRTWFVVLTDRDINARSRNQRFLFSFHGPMTRTSVLSVARLQHDREGRPATDEVVLQRVRKMLLRVAGEMKFGWQRTSDPADLMFSPILSLDDIDRMDLGQTLQARRNSMR